MNQYESELDKSIKKFKKTYSKVSIVVVSIVLLFIFYVVIYTLCN